MTLVTPEHIKLYERDGAVLIKGAFKEWVEPLTEAIKSSIAAYESGDADMRQRKVASQREASVEDNFGGGKMVLNIVPYNDTFRDWKDNSPAAQMTAQIMQSKISRFWQDASFLKDQNDASEGTPWHNDTCTWPFWGKQMAILWVALTEIEAHDGALRTVPGTHHGDGRYYSPFFEPTDHPPAPFKPWKELLAKAEDPEANIATWEMQPGDCLLMHPSIVHGSHTRTPDSNRPRLSFSTRWLGDDVIYKPTGLLDTDMEMEKDPRMVVGGPVPDELMPTTWSSPA